MPRRTARQTSRNNIALRSLIERFPGIALATTVAPEWNDLLVLRGMQSLPVRLRSIRRKLGVEQMKEMMPEV